MENTILHVVINKACNEINGSPVHRKIIPHFTWKPVISDVQESSPRFSRLNTTRTVKTSTGRFPVVKLYNAKDERLCTIELHQTALMTETPAGTKRAFSLADSDVFGAVSEFLTGLLGGE